MEVLPAEGCAVYIADHKITSRLYSTLLDRWHEAEAREYLATRHDIDANLFSAIQWRSMKFALLKLSLHRRAIAVKAIHRHLPTQDKLFQQGRATMCALCPRCITQAETNAHVFSCGHNDAVQQWLKDWGELQCQLVRINTATIIQRVWVIQLWPLLALPSPNDLLENLTLTTHDDINSCLQAAIAEQDAIGWDKLLLGMGSSMWQTLQSMIDNDNPRPPNRSAEDWMNWAIHQLIKFSMRCWKSRNQAVHGSNAKESKQKALDKVRQRIVTLYENPPQLAPQFPSIQAIPVFQRLRLPLAAAEKWLSLIEHQVKVTAHNAKLLLRQHRTIPEHFRRMATCQQRSSSMPRSHRLQQGKESLRRATRRRTKNVRPLTRHSSDSVFSTSAARNRNNASLTTSPRRLCPPNRRHPP